MPDSQISAEAPWLGISLTWTAGFIDAVGYLLLSRIYSANMSGNSVEIAIESAQKHWRDMLAHACPLLAFFPGVVAGAAIVKLSKHASHRVALVPAMIVEAILLACFMIVGESNIPVNGELSIDAGSIYVLLVGLLAFSMGLQNGALRETSSLKNVHTFVTGALLAAADALTEFLFGLFGRGGNRRLLGEATFAASLWLIYVIGAVIGAMLYFGCGIAVISMPACVLLIIAVVDYFNPISKN